MNQAIFEVGLAVLASRCLNDGCFVQPRRDRDIVE